MDLELGKSTTLMINFKKLINYNKKINMVKHDVNAVDEFGNSQSIVDNRMASPFIDDTRYCECSKPDVEKGDDDSKDQFCGLCSLEIQQVDEEGEIL